MFDLFLRNVKEDFLNPLARIFYENTLLSPNKISIIAFLFGLLSSMNACLGYYNLALLFWFLNRILDGLDGTIARTFNLATDFGGYLDIVCDFTVYSLIPIGITLQQHFNLIPGNENFFINWLILSFLLSSYFVNAASLLYLSALLEKQKKTGAKEELTSIIMPVGLIEGTETFVFYTFFLIFPNFSPVLFFIFASCVVINIFQRLRWAYFHLDTHKQ